MADTIDWTSENYPISADVIADAVSDLIPALRRDLQHEIYEPTVKAWRALNAPMDRYDPEARRTRIEVTAHMVGELQHVWHDYGAIIADFRDNIADVAYDYVYDHVDGSPHMSDLRIAEVIAFIDAESILSALESHKSDLFDVVREIVGEFADEVDRYYCDYDWDWECYNEELATLGSLACYLSRIERAELDWKWIVHDWCLSVLDLLQWLRCASPLSKPFPKPLPFFMSFGLPWPLTASDRLPSGSPSFGLPWGGTGGKIAHRYIPYGGMPAFVPSRAMSGPPSRYPWGYPSRAGERLGRPDSEGGPRTPSGPPVLRGRYAPSR